MSMHLRRLGFAVVGALLLASLGAACGGGDDDDDVSVTKTCCLNGAFYECSDSERMCTASGHTCDRMPSRDDECS